MFGWQGVQMMIQLEGWVQAQKLGRELTVDEWGAITRRIFDRTLEAQTELTVARVNYSEAQRRTASVTGLLKVAGVAGLLAFFLVATAMGF